MRSRKNFIKNLQIVLLVLFVGIAFQVSAQQYGVLKVHLNFHNTDTADSKDKSLHFLFPFYMNEKCYPTDSSGNCVIDSVPYGRHLLTVGSMGIDKAHYIANIDSDTTYFEADIYEDLRHAWSEREAMVRWEMDMAFIQCPGGVAPVFYGNEKDFLKKYGVEVRVGDCLTPVVRNDRYIKEYNRTIYRLLDKEYGNKWRKDLRNDAIGLKKYR